MGKARNHANFSGAPFGRLFAAMEFTHLYVESGLIARVLVYIPNCMSLMCMARKAFVAFMGVFFRRFSVWSCFKGKQIHTAKTTTTTFTWIKARTNSATNDDVPSSSNQAR